MAKKKGKMQRKRRTGKIKQRKWKLPDYREGGGKMIRKRVVTTLVREIKNGFQHSIQYYNITCKWKRIAEEEGK